MVQLEENEVQVEKDKWKCALIAYVIGECPGYNTISRIASAIRVPLFADECTTKQTRISYARMLIEVNVTKPIPQQITIMDPNGGTVINEQVFKQNKEPEQIARENNFYTTAKKGKQEIYQVQDKQTPGELSQINLRPNAR
ncbi:hypothetical protein H5410_006159, partial [Solanum commersonii]